MKRISVFIILLSFFIPACATTMASITENLSLGMTKQEVIDTVGKPGTVAGAGIRSDGKSYEVLEFNVGDIISARFVDDKLDRWRILHIPSSSSSTGFTDSSTDFMNQ